MSRIRVQMHYIKQDILKNKASSAFELIEIIIAMIILCYSIQAIITAGKTVIAIREIPADTLLRVVDNSSERQFDNFINDSGNEETIKTIDLCMDTLEGARRVIVNNSITIVTDEDGEEINLLRVNGNFWKMFGIDVSSIIGTRVFDEEAKLDGVPVVMGSELKGLYKEGDIVEINGDGTKIIIEGFLKKDTNYLDSFQQQDVETLDHYIIAPARWRGDGLTERLGNVINTFFICEDKNNVSDRFEEEISEKADFIDTADVSPQMRRAIGDNIEEILTMMILFSVIMLYTLIGIVSRIEIYLNEHRLELAIHIMHGAAMADLAGRILGKYMAMLIVAATITSLIPVDTVARAGSISLGCMLILSIILGELLKISTRSVEPLLRGIRR